MSFFTFLNWKKTTACSRNHTSLRAFLSNDTENLIAMLKNETVVLQQNYSNPVRY